MAATEVIYFLFLVQPASTLDCGADTCKHPAAIPPDSQSHLMNIPQALVKRASFSSAAGRLDL